ncbi:hypothetical protein CLOSBL3_13131 [Clostridiaceae bacterium BL-3]|nr:hypothetical protein CLOSBL3_13131 [Clostridiaceae bacterium BL-3]
MNKIGIKVFKYRGQKFILAENESGSVPRFRIKKYGIAFIFIKKNLSARKRNLELHRLITGKRVRSKKVKDVELTM